MDDSDSLQPIGSIAQVDINKSYGIQRLGNDTAEIMNRLPSLNSKSTRRPGSNERSFRGVSFGACWYCRFVVCPRLCPRSRLVVLGPGPVSVSVSVF